MESLGKTLVLIGCAVVVFGAVLWLIGRSGGGWLPGDIVIERKHVRFYSPLVTCIVVSRVLSAIAWFLRR